MEGRDDDERSKRDYFRRRAGWFGCCGCCTLVALALLIGLLAGLLSSSSGGESSPATMTVSARYFNLTRINTNALCSRTILVNPNCNATFDASGIEQQVLNLSI